MSHRPINLIHAEVLAPYERALKEGGAPVERLFEGCGIPLEAVSTPHCMLPMRQGYRLMETAARYAGDESFGSRVGMDLRLYELGELGQAIQQAPTLFDAGRVVMSAIRDSEPGSQCWIERDAQEAWFCYRPIERFDRGGAQAEQFDLEALLQFIRLVGGEDWQPRRARVSKVTSEGLARTRNFEGVELKQHATMTAIAFPSEFLSETVSRGSEAPSEWNRGTGHSSTESVLLVADAVRVTLESLSEFQPLPTLKATAGHLGMNTRGLQRTLADEGTSYREITERILFRRAVSLLKKPAPSIKTIASELGYSSPSSFVRAFKRIANITPMAYRNRELAKP